MSGSHHVGQHTKVMHPSPKPGHVARVWTIPPLAQYDATTCWEACGRMLFFWKHRHNKDPKAVLAAYQKAAGQYLNDYFRKGLEAERDYFIRHLGMKEAKGQNAAVVEKYLKEHSPLMIRVRLSGGGHAMVLNGCSDRNWYYINPQVRNKGAATQHTFGEHTARADTHGKEIHDENTVITPHGAFMDTKQSSWHAAQSHRDKRKLFEQMKLEFFYYEKSRNK